MVSHPDGRRRGLGFLSGLGLGAGVMYLLDPDLGRRRRALARDKVVHGTLAARAVSRKGAADLEHRVEGLAHDVREMTAGAPDVGDPVLVERVRARMGRVVSHPHALRVEAKEGRVRVSGPILAQEAEPLLRAVRGTSGAHEVEDGLERHERAGRVPELQGGVERGHRRGFMQEHWSPSNRLLAIGGGAALAGFGLARQGALGGIAAGAGGMLLVRAVSNMPLRNVLGIGARRGFAVTKHVHIDAAASEVFRVLGDFESYPRFMEHVREVHLLDDHRSHWVVRGPGGVPIGLDVERTELVDDRIIAWRASGPFVRGEGVVRLDPAPDGGTRVGIRMSYTPPAGLLGHAVAALFRADPKHALDDDMVRLKSLLELGLTRAHGEPVRRDEVGRR